MSYARHFYGDRLGERLESIQPQEPFNCDSLTKIEQTPRAVTLVVVDMQPGFMAAQNRKTIEAVARQIQYARTMNWSVVVLEFDPWKFGPTHPELMKLLDGYDRTMMRIKSVDSGAPQVIEACYDFRYGTDMFWVVGVMIDACVQQTVLGLHNYFQKSRIRVVEEACNTDYNHADAWACFPKKDRIVISSEQLVFDSMKVAA